MSTEFTLASGRRGSVKSIVDKKAELLSPEPAPPGSTVKGRVDGVNSCFLEVKVRSCRRVEGAEGELFLVEGRLQNATRELLQRLADDGGAQRPA